MKKIIAIFIFLMLLAVWGTALAGGDHGNTGTGGDPDDNKPSDELQYDIYGVFENIVQQIVAAFGDQGDRSGDTAVTDCLFIDIDLPDSVVTVNNYSPMPITGYFFLANCGDQETQVNLSFEFTAQIEDIIDTTLTFEDYTIILQAGDSISVAFPFPVPPYDAVYTLCVTAASGDYSVSDCATMTVYGNNQPGVPFNAPGFLVQGPDCVVFEELGDSNAYLILENLGDFQPGDTVFVSGWLVQDCDIDCTIAGGCVINNTITSWPPPPPPPPPIEICGVLFEGENCVLFAPLGYGDTAFVLDNYGTFQPGDTVLVSGTFIAGCETDCVGAMACIADNTIESCSAPPPPPPFFAGCGVLIDQIDCLVFVPENSTEPYFLFDYGNYFAGDTVYVEGDIVGDCYNTCNLPLQCIDNYLIAECDSIIPPPPPPFADCGMLVQGTDCVLFQPMSMGDTLFLLQDYGPFQPGDSVFVAGTVGPVDDTACVEAMAFVWNDVIDTCGAPPPPPPPVFSGCGLLVESTGCTLFKPDGYGDSLFMLINYGEFQAGDSVYVTGQIYFMPDSVCTESMGYIDNATIDYCGVPPGPFAGCGILYEDQNCLIFMPFDSLPGGFLLYNYGDFGNYDTVYVEGEIVNCGTVCNNVIACIDNPVIEACDNTPPPPPTIDACGYLLQSGDCVLFKPFTWFNDYYVLSNYGDFQPGDSVHVTGTISILPDTIPCPGPVAFIDNSVIEECPYGPDTEWAGVGVLVSGDNCLYFEGLDFAYTAFELENYGDFGEGDTVIVDGTIDYTCQTVCLDIGLCLIDNTIQELPGGPDTLIAAKAQVSDVSCHPNPFNPKATISFDLSSPTHVTLSIYNILGQKVETLINGEIMVGPQQVEWNGNRFASGIYFYQIVTDNESITKKMVLSK
jgi:hypothetical protein